MKDACLFCLFFPISGTNTGHILQWNITRSVPVTCSKENGLKFPRSSAASPRVPSGPVLEESEAWKLSCLAPAKCDCCSLRALCKFVNTLSPRLKPYLCLLEIRHFFSPEVYRLGWACMCSGRWDLTPTVKLPNFWGTSVQHTGDFCSDLEVLKFWKAPTALSLQGVMLQFKSPADRHLLNSLRILADPFPSDLASWWILSSFLRPLSCSFPLLMNDSTCIAPQCISALGHLSHLLCSRPFSW